MLKKLKDYRRIVVKIGSALLVDRATGLKRDWLESLDRISQCFIMRALKCWWFRPAPLHSGARFWACRKGAEA